MHHRRITAWLLLLFLEDARDTLERLVSGAVQLVHGIVGNGVGFGDDPVLAIVL